MKKTLITLALFLASCTSQKQIAITFEPLVFDIKQSNIIAYNDTVKIRFEESGYSVKLYETTYNSRLVIQKLDTLIEVSK